MALRDTMRRRGAESKRDCAAGYALEAVSACGSCGTKMAGVFAAAPGQWGSRRLAVDIERYVA
jgi:hypothetical protein